MTPIYPALVRHCAERVSRELRAISDSIDANQFSALCAGLERATAAEQCETVALLLSAVAKVCHAENEELRDALRTLAKDAAFWGMEHVEREAESRVAEKEARRGRR